MSLSKVILRILLFFTIGINSYASESEPYRELRTKTWIWLGADQIELSNALDKIRATPKRSDFWDIGESHKPGFWKYEFETLGRKHEKLGEKYMRDRKSKEKARLHFSKASVYYGLARYPFISRSIKELKLNRKHLRTYFRSWKLSPYEIEVVSTMFKGKRVYGLLHTSKTRKRSPLIIGSSGIDIHAAEYSPFVENLVEKGFAVLMTDIPGTGMNAHLKLKNDGDKLFSKFITKLKYHKKIDTKKIGVFSNSFGANFASKIAFTDKRVSAVANICGPIHTIFQLQEGQIKFVAPMTKDAFATRARVKPATDANIAAALKPFSLITQGIIKDTTKTETAILSVNAKGDFIAPEFDINLITNASSDGSILYDGEDTHCPENRENVMPKVADWFSEQLQ